MRLATVKGHRRFHHSGFGATRLGVAADTQVRELITVEAVERVRDIETENLQERRPPLPQ